MTALYNSSQSIELSGLGCQHAKKFDGLYIPLNAITIQEDFKRAQDAKEREDLKRQFSGMFEYVRQRRGSGDVNFHQMVDRLARLVDSFNISEYNACVPCPEPGESLRAVVHSIISEKRFIKLGPELQKVGKATGDCRFVCPFCHEVKVKTADLRTHLVGKHFCERDEVKQIFNRSKPQGLQVFGQYSYDDVCINRWNIKDWRQRKQRSDCMSDVKRRNENTGPTQRRPRTTRCSSTTSQLPTARERHLEEQTNQSAGLTQDATTLSTFSPITQTLQVDQFGGVPNLTVCDNDLDMLEDLSSMETSTDDLAHVGTGVQTDNWPNSHTKHYDGSLNPASIRVSAGYAPASIPEGDQCIDPQLLMLPTTIPPYTPAKAFDPCKTLLHGPVRLEYQKHKT